MPNNKPQQDLLDGCNDQNVPVAEFTAMFCSRCRQPACKRAGWSQDKFSRRVALQETRLLNPLAADLTQPKFALLAQQDFADMLEHAIRLDLSAQRNDWEIPEIMIRDGVPVQEPKARRDAIDEASRKLRFRADDFVSMDDVPDEIDAGTGASSEDDSFDPYDEQALSEDIALVKPISLGTAPFQPIARNVPNAGAQGIMLDGGPTPVTTKKEPPIDFDPWAPPPPKVVTVPLGARVKMGPSE